MNNIEHYREFIKEVLHNYYKVSDKSIEQLITNAKIRHLEKGKLLLSVGERARHIYFLFQGSVVSCYLNNEGKLYHKNIFLEGNIVGSIVSLLNNQPSNFSLETIEKSILIEINYSKYKQLINENIDFKNFYISYLERNWVIDKEKREIDIILKEAKDRYIDFIRTHPDIENRIALQYIASHLGITPTQLSRIRKKMK